MPPDTDLLLERRRLKRRLGWWRGAAVLLLVLGAFLAFAPRLSLPGGAHVARLPVRGFIGDDSRLIRTLDEAVRNPSMRAVVVTIDSPGGSVSGGEALHGALARMRAAGKPVVAAMGGTATSAGYMVALPAERVFAREATLTGSIGVILHSFEATELMATLGVRANTIASGPLKDQPSPFRPLTEEGRAALAAVVGDMHEQFVAMVATGRRMEPARVRELADGRVMTGRQALGVGLVDAIGGEAEARRWLAQQHNVSESLPIRDIDPRNPAERIFSRGAALVWGAAIESLATLLTPR
ncbi:signal peptide peptidase SppA [Sabulicella glaciei]|uniref:Signal peptide peptidase SppA n=1 Tax=Sabulicella glaciei TaxID=2984948 RepID=A0ABT3NZ75_9PROT|nr:signal peptide peptidase SppA [Roseococcus sp. MDT2-1-1]MCW8087449.1 signal peptide peptidase SppA [Roseococcus sp. MDT2-1-1]